MVWDSSNKPLYVRTVKMNGLPYNILTHDDFEKFRKRTYTASGKGAHRVQRKHSNNENAQPWKMNLNNGDFLKLKRIFNSNKDVEMSRSKIKSDDNVRYDDKSVRSDDDKKHAAETFAVNVITEELHNLNDVDSIQRRISDINVAKMKSMKSHSPNNFELSERVIEWLDLAGKGELLVQDNARWNMPRHSFPEIRNRVKNCQLARFADRRKSLNSPANNIGSESRMADVLFARDCYESMSSIEDGIKEPDVTTKLENQYNETDKVSSYNVNRYTEIMPSKFENDGPRQKVHIFIPSFPKKQIVRTPSLLSSSTGFSRLN